jgi:TM2 domain-containing membrane protein YozV
VNNKSSSTTIFCPNCAWENPLTSKKCTHCGCRLADVRVEVKQSALVDPSSNPSILEPIFCTSCGEKMAKEASNCPSCGAPNKGSAAMGDLEIKSKVAAGVLALLVGGLGIHKFYCGRVGLGILYLLFFWTFIPAIIAFIEGIIYLTCPSDEMFTKKYCY